MISCRMDTEKRDDEKVGATVRITQPAICAKPLTDPIKCLGAASAITTWIEAL